MSKIWVFGDSYSADFKDGDWAKTYVEYLGRQPKIFVDYLSEKLNLEYVNHAVGGADNYEILERFCKCSPLIKENDIVIFGWSSIPRFRLVTKDNRWVPMVPHHNNFLGDFDDISERTVNEILVNRMSIKYAEELNNWITFINLQKFTSIHWTPFEHHEGIGFKPISISYPETITKTTNGDVIDGHFSEAGQIQLSKIILDLIRNHGNII
jgi:hypothetical protein